MNDSTPAGDDWGPFGRPLFEDPSARALSRVGVVDVGSNSVRLVVFDGAARSPAYFYNEKILCGLGAGLATTGHLNPKGRERALAALRRFALLAKGMGIALADRRRHRRGARGQRRGGVPGRGAGRETGLRLWVIDGTEEARLSAQGVLLGWPEAEGIVCDIGGSSMELAVVGGGRIGKRADLAARPVPAATGRGRRQGSARSISQKVVQRAARTALDADHRKLYLVGGSWRAIARLDMERRGYPLTVLHEYRMTPKSVLATVDWIGQNDLDRAAPAHRHLVGTDGTGAAGRRGAASSSSASSGRSEIDVSSYGIREGLLYEQMPQRLRARDPADRGLPLRRGDTARGCRASARSSITFLMPLFKRGPRARLRLIRAACLLHDTTWRAHPDYRAEVCFDNATRANLGGLDHRGRVFLGLALLHRYKNSRSGTRFEPLFRLLSDRGASGRRGAGQGDALRRDVLDRRPDAGGRAALLPAQGGAGTGAPARGRRPVRRGRQGAVLVAGLGASGDAEDHHRADSSARCSPLGSPGGGAGVPCFP